MESNDNNIDEVLKTYLAKPSEEQTKAAQLRVLQRLRAKYDELKGERDIIAALRKVAFESLHPDDLPALQAVSQPGLEGQGERIAKWLNSWFYKEFPRDAVEAAFDRLERHGWISVAGDKAARVFAITAEGEAALARGRAAAKKFVAELEDSITHD
jgi:hypothetical protein